MIELVVKPGPGIPRAEFVASHPPFSIALDGYVSGAPFLHVDGTRPWRSFNHHEVVDRSSTCATCEQARRAVLLGLYDLFRERGARRAIIHANDCDQDVCLASWILMNPDRAAEPLVRVLSQVEDLLDMSSGVFPFPHERDRMAEVRWVFDPYVRARPRVAQMGAEEMREVVRDVHLRIEQFVVGSAGKVPLDGEYNVLTHGDGWILAEVTRLHARERMVASGIKAAVELTARLPDGRFAYSVWRRSEYIVSFPVPEILAALSEAEGRPGSWGGADTVGGSPRPGGSTLAPERVAEVVARVVASAKG
ncbi:MAG TPA: hypothetical protein VFF73_13270 [Planctomycetota bacterium]|nr:hypothetical protein [Planctomycetota bacterium]